MDVWAVAALSGLAAALVAIAATVAVEKFGGSLGGVLATLPTTIIPATAGWAYRVDAQGLALACANVPPGQLIDAIFLLVWRYLPPRLPQKWPLYHKLAVMIASSIAVWFVLAVAFVGARTAARPSVAGSTSFAILCTAVIVGMGLVSCVNLPPAPPKPAKSPPGWLLAARGVVAGVAIMIAVYLGSVDQVVGGIASTFPAIFSTVQVALWLSHGEALPLSATGPMVLGSCSVAVYALVYAEVAPTQIGPVLGALVTWPASIGLVSVPIALFLRWRGQVAAAKAAGVPSSQPEAGPADGGHMASDVRAGLTEPADRSHAGVHGGYDVTVLVPSGPGADGVAHVVESSSAAASTATLRGDVNDGREEGGVPASSVAGLGRPS